MPIADALSHYAPLVIPVIPLNVSVNHVHIMPQKKIDFQDAMHSHLTLCTLVEMILLGWPEDICNVPMDLCPYHHACDVLTVEDSIILHGEALIIPPVERNKVLQSIHEGHQGISKCQYHAHQCVYWSGINQDIKHAIDACATCQCHCPQEPQQLLKPTPAPECPWQCLGANFMHFDGNEYLIIIDYYSKMPFICKIPPSQWNATKMMSTLKNCLLSMAYQSHSTVTMAPSLPAPSLQNLLLTGTLTSAPTNPHSNGQAEAAVKIIKGLLIQSKYSGQDPTLPYLPTAVHLWMHTCIHLVRCSTSMPCAQWCHSISAILIHMLLPTMTI